MTANEDRMGAEKLHADSRRLARLIQRLKRENPEGLLAFINLGLRPTTRKTSRKQLNPTTSCH